jgi:hypothetical protein
MSEEVRPVVVKNEWSTASAMNKRSMLLNNHIPNMKERYELVYEFKTVDGKKGLDRMFQKLYNKLRENLDKYNRNIQKKDGRDKEYELELLNDDVRVAHTLEMGLANIIHFQIDKIYVRPSVEGIDRAFKKDLMEYKRLKTPEFDEALDHVDDRVRSEIKSGGEQDMVNRLERDGFVCLTFGDIADEYTHIISIIYREGKSVEVFEHESNSAVYLPAPPNKLSQCNDLIGGEKRYGY